MKFKTAQSISIRHNVDYDKSIIFSPVELPAKGSQIQIVTIPPKAKQRLHVHRIQTEACIGINGTCEIIVNNKTIYMRPGDALLIEPNDTHYLWNKSSILFSILVVKYNYEENDMEWLE